MKENIKSIESLEFLRNRLNTLIEVQVDLLEPEIMSVSQMLDQIINKYFEENKMPPG